MSVAAPELPLDRVIEQIKELVGPKGWLAEPAAVEPYVVEWRGLYRGRTPLVVRPMSTEQVAGVMRLAYEHGIPVVPQGGNTSLCGASVPYEAGDEIVLSLNRMNAVREIDPLNYTITVEAGCVLADVQRAASEADRLFPLSLAAEGSCMIGGNLSTNAGGVNVLKYGNARELVLGLEVVLPDGQVWNGLRRLRKDNTGYDLKQLFLGAEGTLGVITAAVLKLFPKPRDRRVAFLAVPDVPSAIELLARARAASADSVMACELIPRLVLDLVLKHIPDSADPLEKPYDTYLLIELATTADGDDGLGERLETILETGMEAGLILDGAIAQSESQADDMWRLRENAAEAQRIEGPSIKHDVAVPVSRVAEFLEETSRRIEAAMPGVRIVAFGHLGDGNIHYNLQAAEGADAKAFYARWGEMNRIVHDMVTEMHGSISAEHGIGRLKRDELRHYKSPVELELMRRIKRAIDPKGIMNPGKVL